MTRYFNYVLKTWKQRTLREKFLFWKKFYVFVDAPEESADYQEVFLHGKLSFSIQRNEPS